MDAVVVDPYGIAPGQKARDIESVKGVARGLLPIVARALNEYHAADHETRYWEIVLGHWLLRYCSAVFNRYASIKQALARHELSGTTVFTDEATSLATPTSNDFVWACNDDRWNNILYGRLLTFIGAGTVAIEHVDAPPSAGAATGGARSSRAQTLAAHAGGLLQRFARDEDAFLINTYLPVSQRVRLELSLGQCPQLWRSPAPTLVAPDERERSRFRVEFDREHDFERFLGEQLPLLIPSCFLEGHGALTEQASKLPWPRRPKVVFTSNSFDMDELFKVWVAGLAERGAPYMSGQHGNNYGTHLSAGAHFWPERSATDRFITWGWSDGDPRTTPAFLFKTAGQAPRSGRPHAGGLLLIELPLPHRIDTYDSDAEFAIYQEEQFRFVEALPVNVRDQLTVRLHGEYRRHPWFEEQRWHDRSPETRLEKGETRIHTLVDRSRLVVHSYDSTGILETLALDIPTLCFWHGREDHLIEDAKPYYRILRDAEILCDTPEQCAAMVALHWGDVQHWWQSTHVRKARALFCERYARTVPHPVRTLGSLLRPPFASIPAERR